MELKSGINSSNMVRVELTNSLVGEYRPGDTLRIVGVPKVYYFTIYPNLSIQTDIELKKILLL